MQFRTGFVAFIIVLLFTCSKMDSFSNIVNNRFALNSFKKTEPLTVVKTPKNIHKSSRIIYNKRFVKRYRKAQRLLKAWLQSNEEYAGFCRYKLAQHILILNHPFNLWLTSYLSLFALFRI